MRRCDSKKTGAASCDHLSDAQLDERWAAIGAPGFLGRWMDYAATDHGGNANVKDKAAADLDVTVLGHQSDDRPSSTAS